jgi:hypothetical protein
LLKLECVREVRGGVTHCLDSGEAGRKPGLDEKRGWSLDRTGLDRGDGEAQLEVVQPQAHVADRVAVGEAAHTDRLHGRGKAVNQTSLDEL